MIRPDFSALRKVAESIGAKNPDITFGPGNTPPPHTPINLKEPKSEDIEFAGGVLGYKGQQVLLYIADQGAKFFEVLDTPELGRRFHLTNCSTIEEMRSKGRYKRYVATNNTSGKFQVIGSTSDTIDKADRIAELIVCQNCLKRLNYKGYLSEQISQRKILENFDIEAFFASYSTIFDYISVDLPDHSDYPKNWKEISDQFRSSKNFHCEQCDLNLNRHKSFLHSHHRNGNKYECESSNLQALCEDCHRKMPLHNHMKMSAADFRQLQGLRREQGILSRKNWVLDGWNEALAYADIPFEGLLRTYRNQKWEAPELHILNGTAGNSVIAEVAWPKAKIAITPTEKGKLALEKLGWEVTTLSEALEKEEKARKNR